jgi:phosphoribosyl-ATP pyrophosphohydrolase/phosphoribosyl-AMP cyclohydrolase
MSNQPVPLTTNLDFLNILIGIIHERKQQMHEPEAASSYTVSLFHDGLNKIAQKVGEEAVELIIEAKDADDERFKNEAADLVFHLLVLLEEKQIPLADVIKVLEKRHQR